MLGKGGKVPVLSLTILIRLVLSFGSCFRTLSLSVLQRFAPIVDYLEVAVNRIDSSTQENGTSADKEAHVSQYSRALELSVRLRDQLQSYSNEQMTQLQAHSALVYVI